MMMFETPYQNNNNPYTNSQKLASRRTNSEKVQNNFKFNSNSQKNANFS